MTNIHLKERKYAIAMLLNAFTAEEQQELKRVLALLLRITPQMLTLYINARKDETKYSLSDEKLIKLQRFFSLNTIDEVCSKAPNIDESILSSFKNRISVSNR